MTMRDISRRLDRLDSARPVADRRVVWMKRNEDEPVAVAIARWCEAHPDEPPPVDDDNTLIIMRVIVAPKPRQATGTTPLEAKLADTDIPGMGGMESTPRLNR
jgi:hypothetical protein